MKYIKRIFQTKTINTQIKPIPKSQQSANQLANQKAMKKIIKYCFNIDEIQSDQNDIQQPKKLKKQTLVSKKADKKLISNQCLLDFGDSVSSIVPKDYNENNSDKQIQQFLQDEDNSQEQFNLKNLKPKIRKINLKQLQNNDSYDRQLFNIKFRQFENFKYANKKQLEEPLNEIIRKIKKNLTQENQSQKISQRLDKRPKQLKGLF